jgi:hypothetical protein
MIQIITSHVSSGFDYCDADDQFEEIYIVELGDIEVPNESASREGSTNSEERGIDLKENPREWA